METYFLNLPISTKIALISFTIGSLLFGDFFLIPSSDNLIFIGLFYTLLAIILNGITVIQVLIALYQKSDLSKTLLNFIV